MTDLSVTFTADAQLALDTVTCKERGCAEPVVGSSTTGEGHVCRRHNEAEWGRALSRSEWRDYRELGARLLEDSRA